MITDERLADLVKAWENWGHEDSNLVLIALRELQHRRAQAQPGEVDIEMLLDNAATAAQERALLRDDNGAETVLREAIRLNVCNPLLRLLRASAAPAPAAEPACVNVSLSAMDNLTRHLGYIRWWEYNGALHFERPGKPGYIEVLRYDQIAAPQPAQADGARAFEEALSQTWEMIDPLSPAGAPGSYARGSYSGIIVALKTIRDNFDRAYLARTGGEEER